LEKKAQSQKCLILALGDRQNPIVLLIINQLVRRI